MRLAAHRQPHRSSATQKTAAMPRMSLCARAPRRRLTPPAVPPTRSTAGMLISGHGNSAAVSEFVSNSLLAHQQPRRPSTRKTAAVPRVPISAGAHRRCTSPAVPPTRCTAHVDQHGGSATASTRAAATTSRPERRSTAERQPSTECASDQAICTRGCTLQRAQRYPYRPTNRPRLHALLRSRVHGVLRMQRG